MCGISGFYSKDQRRDLELLKRMSSSIRHRGPDQFGSYLSPGKSLMLAHQRLSILDLSSAGAQPMTSSCERFVIAFNGEIYNFLELKESLEKSGRAIGWRGHSDTEILVECISRWGVERTLSRLNGMFAFALYDSKLDTLCLARDRFGEKPLYIYADDSAFAFASELRPIELFTHNLSVDHSAVDALFRFSYIPAPYSIYREVFKLLPGHWLEIDLKNYRYFTAQQSRPYWSIADTIQKGLHNRAEFKTVEDAIDASRDLLSKSVALRMVSDVPLGAFLSGGIDSTCVTALMQALSTRKIKTFSIGTHDSQYNEAHHAKAVAEILGTDHHELYLDAADILKYIPAIHTLYDEPFADSSQLPSLAIAEFARRHVTVALTGDAGDEVYCGYNRYQLGPALISRFGGLTPGIRRMMSAGIRTFRPETYTRIAAVLAKLMPQLAKHKRVGDNAYKLARVLAFRDEQDLYNLLINNWPETAVTGEIHDIATDISTAFGSEGLCFTERMMWQDAIGYLPNDILTKVDRASMASSLETRIPFLDNDVFQHAWSLPPGYKLYEGNTKYPLRRIVAKYVPDEVMNRPKTGFGIPIYDWLRTDLRDWAEDLLSMNALESNGFLDSKKIRGLWQAHLSGRTNQQYALWNVLMFQQWQTARQSRINQHIA